MCPCTMKENFEVVRLVPERFFERILGQCVDAGHGTG